MVKITSLCNAGFALEYNGQVLLIDALCSSYGPYYGLPEQTWSEILQGHKPYDRICGIYITHDHPDHSDRELLRQYQSRWPQIPIFVPQEEGEGYLQWGPFHLQYRSFPHAPMLHGVPPHVVTWITAGEKTMYFSGDAALEPERHRDFINGRIADAAIWNAMYLSRAETRTLLSEVSRRNLICHMPKERGDWAGIWKKCDSNFRRYGSELQSVQVLEGYPNQIEL